MDILLWMEYTCITINLCKVFFHLMQSCGNEKMNVWLCGHLVINSGPCFATFIVPRIDCHLNVHFERNCLGCVLYEVVIAFAYKSGRLWVRISIITNFFKRQYGFRNTYVQVIILYNGIYYESGKCFNRFIPNGE
jgi:hypothetical protein